MIRPTLSILLLGLLSFHAPAQQVWVVDDTAGTGADFFEPQSAINAASDGDTILVRAGFYNAAFIIDGKSLTVAADAGAAAHVPGFRVRNLAAGQSVAVIGLTADLFANQSFTPGVEVVKITECAGPVLVQDCLLPGGTLFVVAPLLPTVRIVNAAAVNFERCTLLGRIDTPTLSSSVVLTAEALSSTGSQVQLAHCTVTGAAGHDDVAPHPASPGRQAVTLLGSRLILQGSTITGGQGGNGGFSPSSQSCSLGQRGGDGIVFGDAASTAVQRASTVSGGAGGIGGVNPDLGSGCPAGADGAAFAGPGLATSLPGGSDPLDIVPAIVREGGAGTLVLHGTSGSSAWLLPGFGQSQLWLPAHAGVLLPTATALIVPLGVVPASGEITLPYVAPVLPAGVTGVTLVLQSASVGAGPVLLGGGGALVIIDAAL